MPGEPFDRKRIHHWHLGAILAGILNVLSLWHIWLKFIFTSATDVNVPLAVIFTAGAVFGDLWALDDGLWHWKGFKWLPGHILHEWLSKWWIYSAIDGWIKKAFK